MYQTGLALILGLCMFFLPLQSVKAAEINFAEYVTSMRGISDPIAQNMLQMLNEDDYDGFSRDFGAKMRASLPEEKFDEFHQVVADHYGKYKSMEFVSLESKGEATTFFYKTAFTKVQAPVLLRIVFTYEQGRMRPLELFLEPLPQPLRPVGQMEQTKVETNG